MRTLNPYEELGVPRNADGADIRKAYRLLSKSRHPDAGGDAAGWERLRRSYDVLMDERLRKTYDDTGRVEEDRPDNDRAGALQIIEMHCGELINEYLLASTDRKALKDPRRKNLTSAISGRIKGEIAQAEEAIPNGREVLEFFRDMKGRFTVKDAAKVGDDFLTRMVDAQISKTEEQIRGLEENVRVRKLALDIVAGYDFRYDAPPAPTVRSAGFDYVRGFDALAESYNLGDPTAYSWPTLKDQR